MFERFLEVTARHADHEDTLLTGYPGTRHLKSGLGGGSDLDPVAGGTRPGTRVVNERVEPLL